MAKNKGWPEIGTIVKNEVKDKDGNVMTDSKGQPLTKLNFKFADNVTILVDGQPVEMNKYRTGVMKTPQEEVEGLYKSGAIGDDKIEERREKAKEVNKWLRYKITVPPPRD